MGTGDFRSRDLINSLVARGGEPWDLYATFKGPHADAPWQSKEEWVIRNTPEAALHTAEVWGPKAFAAHCIQILLPDGGEFRTPWERIELGEMNNMPTER